MPKEIVTRNHLFSEFETICRHYSALSEKKQADAKVNSLLNIHEDYYQNLLEKYPDLTSKELRLCAFLKLKMNTKEIANLTNLSVKTIEVYRSQIRRKFRISKSTNLSQFIANI